MFTKFTKSSSNSKETNFFQTQRISAVKFFRNGSSQVITESEQVLLPGCPNHGDNGGEYCERTVMELFAHAPSHGYCYPNVRIHPHLQRVFQCQSRHRLTQGTRSSTSSGIFLLLFCIPRKSRKGAMLATTTERRKRRRQSSQGCQGSIC